MSRREPVKLETLERASLQIVHRGPDAYGTWIDRSGRVGLAHRRLSIVDLFTGNQPLANEDDSIHAVVNGELYDFEEIRKDLERRGHAFRTASDSEILLHLYEEHGVDCLSRLRGEFAFVLWDGRRQRLFAARDRLGNKPLHFARLDDTLYLASEAKALFAAGVPCRWDRSMFLQDLRRVPSEHQTWFDGVHQVRPGHYLLAGFEGSPQQHRYWDFNYPASDGARVISDDDAVHQGREILERAIRRRLQGDVPVGVYLSGGIDSAGLIGIAAKHFARPIEAFTVAWEDAGESEEPLARATAQHVGANLHVCRASVDLLADSLPGAVWHCESPTTLSAAAKLLLSRFTRDQGIKVVLTGEGADDVYAGYSTFKTDNEAEKTDIGVGLDYMRRQVGFVPAWIRRAHRPIGYIAPALSEYLRDGEPSRKFLDETDVAAQLVGLHPLNVSLYLWSKIRLLHIFLPAMGDRTEMSHSIEGRTPYIDHELVEFGCRLPTSLKIRNGVEKFLLRECVRPFVTAAQYRRQKKPFAPPRLRPTGRLLELYRDTLSSSHASDLPFYSRPVMQSALDGVLSKRTRWPAGLQRRKRLRKELPVLQSMVALCLMQEQFRPG